MVFRRERKRKKNRLTSVTKRINALFILAVEEDYDDFFDEEDFDDPFASKDETDEDDDGEGDGEN